MLTVCTGQEPQSLFSYADNSVSARSVRQAIYDGPFDFLGFEIVPVILESVPNLADGSAAIEPVQVQVGDRIVDAEGNLVGLEAGVVYLPAGCRDGACAQEFGGEGPIEIDQLVVRFKLLPDLLWSDGAPLTADDSLYAYELARALFPRVRSTLLLNTAGYHTLDPTTVEWRGLPGYFDAGYRSFFFSPLPRHAWSVFQADELFSAEPVARRPLGWGPYVIDEWTAGDHISLSRNPNYFRAGEGLPAFDRLVFRFMANGLEALTALVAGECDYVDESAHLETEREQVLNLQENGQLAAALEVGTGWEHLDFGILPAVDPESGQPLTVPLFGDRSVRQAVAMCMDRQNLVEELFAGRSQVLDTYVPPQHPLVNPDVRHYGEDPQAAADLLTAAGWLDMDGNPQTPRQSQGVSNVPDGTSLTFSLLTGDDPERIAAAGFLSDALARCGIRAEVQSMPWNELMAAGPDGPVFGRRFQAAQFAWVTGLEPPCFLYTSQEIPGPFPEHPKGWGGANATGYSNPEFDRLCRLANSTLPDMPAYADYHAQAQALFAEDLPVIPLYQHLKLVATRADMCNVLADPSADSALWNLEQIDYGEGCAQ